MKTIKTAHSLCYVASCTFVLIVYSILRYCFAITVPVLFIIAFILVIKDSFFQILCMFYPEIWIMNEVYRQEKRKIAEENPIIIGWEHILGILVAIVITIFVFCVKK